MSARSSTLLLIAIALLIGVELGARVGGGAPAPALLPQAVAQNRPVEAQLRTGTTFVTASGDGAILYVWQCTMVNATPSFQTFTFTASR
jgi:hypothetical protein